MTKSKQFSRILCVVHDHIVGIANDEDTILNRDWIGGSI